MPKGFAELLKDANRTFREKFENAYAAARWVEKSKKQRTSEDPEKKSASKNAAAASEQPEEPP
eukprot:6746698-Karenia_brevis.AAC.1